MTHRSIDDNQILVDPVLRKNSLVLSRPIKFMLFKNITPELTHPQTSVPFFGSIDASAPKEKILTVENSIYTITFPP
jgi:hypothetical protein